MKTYGLILAGGRSTRMGQDKATVSYKGQSLLDHARALMTELNVDAVIVLGRPDEPDGIADDIAHEGPAVSLYRWLLKADLPARIIVTPVDMPLLQADMVNELLKAEPGGYFDDLYLPLAATVFAPPKKQPYRMRDILSEMTLTCVKPKAEWLPFLKNINNPTDLAALDP